MSAAAAMFESMSGGEEPKPEAPAVAGDVSMHANTTTATDSTGSGPQPVEGSSAGNSCLIVEPQKKKRKCRRKPKSKAPKYRNTNWKIRKDQRYRRTSVSTGVGGAHSGGLYSLTPGSIANSRRNQKLMRSRSQLVPYNTNGFLMAEHLADDLSNNDLSEDRFFRSKPQNEEDFLSKEFSNVYEKARVDRLEAMTKQQLIEECLQMEDRYASLNSGNQKLQLQHTQRDAERIRRLEDDLRKANREIIELRRYKRASADYQRPEISSEDSESDSSSSTSSFSSSSSCVSGNSISSSPQVRNIIVIPEAENENGGSVADAEGNGTVNGYHSSAEELENGHGDIE